MRPGDRVEYEWEMAGVMLPGSGVVRPTYPWMDVPDDSVRIESDEGVVQTIPRDQVEVVEESDLSENESV